MSWQQRGPACVISCTPAGRSITGSGPFGEATSDNADMSEIWWVVRHLQRPRCSLEAEKCPPSEASLRLAITPDGTWVNTGQQPTGPAVTTGSMLCLKFRFNLIHMERTFLEDFAIKMRHAHRREGASSRCWERKMGNTDKIFRGVAWCWCFAGRNLGWGCTDSSSSPWVRGYETSP